MLFPLFGTHINLKDNLIKLLSKKNSLGPFQAPVYLLEEYLQNFGIVDLDSPSASPLALVELHDKEGLFDLYSDAKRMDDYLIYRVWDTFHISFDKFMEMPRHKIEAMLARLRPALEQRIKDKMEEDRKDASRKE